MMNFNLTLKERKYLQRAAGVKVDGSIGPKTYAAMRKISGGTNYNRILTRFVQTTFNNLSKNKIKVDGVWGGVTEASLHKLVYGAYPSRKPKMSKSRGIIVPKRPAWTKELPRTTAEKTAYYGKPGSNFVRMYFPFKMYYAGKLTKTTRVNKRCKPMYEHRYEMLLSHFGQSELDRLKISDHSGLANVRKIRGGTAWSSHSWACADDVNAADNRMSMTLAQSRFGSNKYQAYWDIVYESGAMSLGLEHDFDVMHCSYTR